jgi:hypothetical protein
LTICNIPKRLRSLSTARLMLAIGVLLFACTKPNTPTIELPSLVVRVGTSSSLESNLVLDFGDQKSEAPLSLYNVGGGTLTWQAVVTEPWISLIQGNGEFAETGTVSAAEAVTIRVRLNRETAPANPDTAFIQFTSGKQDPIYVGVVVDIVAGTLEPTPTELNFNTGSRQQTLVIRNSGDKAISWSLQSVPDWLLVSDEQASYETSASTPTTLEVQVDRSQIDYKEPKTLQDSIGLQMLETTLYLPVNIDLAVVEVTPDSLVFGPNDFDSQYIEIDYDGIEDDAWTEEVDSEALPSWVRVEWEGGTSRLEVSLPGNVDPDTTSTFFVIRNRVGPDIKIPVTIVKVVPGVLEVELVGDDLEVDANKDRVEFEVSNSGGSPISWSYEVEEYADKGTRWLIPSEFVADNDLQPNEKVSVVLDLDRYSQLNRSLEATVIFRATGISEAKSFNLTANVRDNDQPVASVNPTYHKFIIDGAAGVDDKAVFDIANSGGEVLRWRAVTDGNWYTVIPDSGTVFASTEPGRFEVHVNDKLIGNQAGNILRIEVVDTYLRKIEVGLDAVFKDPRLAWACNNSENVIFGAADSDTVACTITNRGTGVLEWELVGSEEYSWLQVITPTRGATEDGDENSSMVEFVVNRKGLEPTGTSPRTADLTLVTNSRFDREKEVEVEMFVANRPELQVSQDSLILDISNEFSGLLQVSNGNNGVLEWKIDYVPEWLVITSVVRSGSLVVGSVEDIAFSGSTFDRETTDDNPNLYDDEIVFSYDGKTHQIPVRMAIPHRRLLVAQYESFDFGETGESRIIALSNAGYGYVDWEIGIPDSVKTWVEVSDKSGRSYNSPDTVTVSVDRAGLPAGTYDDVDITITDKDGSESIVVALRMENPARYGVSIDSVLNVGFGDEAELAIDNFGNQDIRLEISSDSAWLGSDMANLIMPYGESERLKIFITRVGLEPDNYTGQIRITDLEHGQSWNVRVAMVVAGAVLVFEPQDIEITWTDTVRVELRNNGTTEGEWDLVEKPAWLVVEAGESSRIAPESSIALSLYYDVAANLYGSPEPYIGSIIVASDSVSAVGRVSLAVSPFASLDVKSGKDIDVGAETTGSLDLVNNGNVPIELVVGFAAEIKWLNVDSNVILIPPQSVARVSFLINRAELPIGNYSGALKLQDELLEISEEVLVRMIVPGVILAGEDEIVLEHPYQAVVNIVNSGTIEALWAVNSAPEWLIIDSDNSVIEPNGGSVAIPIRLDPTATYSDTVLSGLLEICAGGGCTETTIEVTILSEDAYAAGEQPLYFFSPVPAYCENNETAAPRFAIRNIGIEPIENLVLSNERKYELGSLLPDPWLTFVNGNWVASIFGLPVKIDDCHQKENGNTRIFYEYDYLGERITGTKLIEFSKPQYFVRVTVPRGSPVGGDYHSIEVEVEEGERLDLSATAWYQGWPWGVVGISGQPQAFDDSEVNWQWYVGDQDEINDADTSTPWLIASADVLGDQFSVSAYAWPKSAPNETFRNPFVASYTVKVKPRSLDSVADAGADTTVEVYSVVTLRGSGLPQNEVAYSWSQKAGPQVKLHYPGSSAGDGSGLPSPMFVPKSEGIYIFELTVRNKKTGVYSEPDQVVINAERTSPQIPPSDRAFYIDARAAGYPNTISGSGFVDGKILPAAFTGDPSERLTVRLVDLGAEDIPVADVSSISVEFWDVNASATPVGWFSFVRDELSSESQEVTYERRVFYTRQRNIFEILERFANNDAEALEVRIQMSYTSGSSTLISARALFELSLEIETEDPRLSIVSPVPLEDISCEAGSPAFYVTVKNDGPGDASGLWLHVYPILYPDGSSGDSYGQADIDQLEEGDTYRVYVKTIGNYGCDPGHQHWFDTADYRIRYRDESRSDTYGNLRLERSELFARILPEQQKRVMALGDTAIFYGSTWGTSGNDIQTTRQGVVNYSWETWGGIEASAEWVKGDNQSSCCRKVTVLANEIGVHQLILTPSRGVNSGKPDTLDIVVKEVSSEQSVDPQVVQVTGEFVEGDWQNIEVVGRFVEEDESVIDIRGEFVDPVDIETGDPTTEDQATLIAPPNGKLLFLSTYLADGRLQVHSINADGTDLRQLTQIQTNYGWPAWGRDENEIFFPISTGGGGWDQGLYRLDLAIPINNGSTVGKVTRVFPGAVTMCHLSPDGKRIALSRSSSTTNEGQIFVCLADGSDSFHVTEGDAPTWTPDGTRILFTADGKLMSTVPQKTSTDVVQLGNWTAAYPMMSPDGQYIVYAALGDIWRVDSSGSNRIRLTESLHENTYPSWYSDENWILFNRQDRQSGKTNIYFMDVDGGNLQSVTSNMDGNFSWPRGLAY